MKNEVHIAEGVSGRTSFRIEMVRERKRRWWWSVNAHRPADHAPMTGMFQEGFLFLNGGDLDFGSGGFGIWNGPLQSRREVVDAALDFVGAFT